MKKDTLDFIRNYAKNRSANTADYLPDGRLEGEVPGYPGLLSREYNLRENLNFSIPLWPGADTHPTLDDIVTVWWKISMTPSGARPFIISPLLPQGLRHR